MALTLVKNKVCNACGADVRPNSLFCYNCGGAIVEKIPAENPTETEVAKEEIIEEKEATDGNLIESKTVANVKTDTIEKQVVREETKLKSAAGLRRKPKSVQRKQIQIVWEEHENAPNVWFLSVAIVIMIMVAAILFLAIYLK